MKQQVQTVDAVVLVTILQQLLQHEVYSSQQFQVIQCYISLQLLQPSFTFDCNCCSPFYFALQLLYPSFTFPCNCCAWFYFSLQLLGLNFTKYSKLLQEKKCNHQELNQQPKINHMILKLAVFNHQTIVTYIFGENNTIYRCFGLILYMIFIL